MARKFYPFLREGQNEPPVPGADLAVLFEPAHDLPEVPPAFVDYILVHGRGFARSAIDSEPG